MLHALLTRFRCSRPVCLTVALLAFMPWLCAAETDGSPPADLDSRTTQLHSDIYLNNDFTTTWTTHFRLKVLKEQAARHLKRRRFSYSTSIEQFDVIEAYTLKANGEKIPVPEDNFQLTINKGNKNGGPVFSDQTHITIVFPSVAVNDTLVMTYKRTETEPMFPGHFSASDYFYRHEAYDDVRLTFNVPADLELRRKVRGMQETERMKGDRHIITLTYANPEPRKEEREDFSVWDESSQPGYAFSTFQNYQSVAEAYGKRALPKAVPTERVRQLAQDIVGDKTNPHEQARLLYEWVASHITYAGHCIGVGAVVPHDTDFILDNKMGDCKDHATLLQALLTTQGIDSTQALVNSGSAYTLPTVPLVTSVNHVINYLPAFDQFVDSTSHSTPFTRLPFQVMDKPVLLVESYRPGMRTPVSRYGDNDQRMHTVLQIQPDGSAKGTITLHTKGSPAVSLRSSWRNITREEEQDWLETTFSNQGRKGIGSMQKDDPQPLKDTFNYTIDFEQPAFLPGSGAGGLYIGPLTYTPFAVSDFLNVSAEPMVADKTTCLNGRSEASYTYVFPDNITVLAVPKNLEISAHHVTYRAHYTLDNNTLTVKRVIEDRTPGNVCDRELIENQKAVYREIQKNLESQLVYNR